MNLFQRVHNLLELSKYEVQDKNLAGDKLDIPKLVDASKPKKKLAIIIQDDPIEQFPTETT